MRQRTAARVALVIVALFCLIAAMSAVAWAHHKDDHEQGNGSEQSEEARDKHESEGNQGGTSDSSQSQSSGGSSSGSSEPDNKDTCQDYSDPDSGNGANTSGSYDPNCDGGPSQNGNDGGRASGRPCEGCVGNADDKNPPGQAPDGTDGNSGYECDGNHGIGGENQPHANHSPLQRDRSNPAHTNNCPSPPPPCPPRQCPPPCPPAQCPPPCPPGQCPPPIICPPGPGPCPPPPICVPGTKPCPNLTTHPASPSPTPPPVCVGDDCPPPPVCKTNCLPITGAELGGFIAAGCGLIGSGFALTRARRRKQRK